MEEIYSKELVENLYNTMQSAENGCIENKYVHKHNKENVLISNIMEMTSDVQSMNGIESDTQYFGAIAYPDYECSFCFDHKLDHLPFISIIEIVRQMGIAIGHKFYNIPLSGFANIMSNMRLQIWKFLELDLSLFIIAKDVVMKRKGTRLERLLRFDLFQNHVNCGNISIDAIIMPQAIYNRLRNNNRTELIKGTSLSKNIPFNVDMVKSYKD